MSVWQECAIWNYGQDKSARKTVQRMVGQQSVLISVRYSRPQLIIRGLLSTIWRSRTAQQTVNLLTMINN